MHPVWQVNRFLLSKSAVWQLLGELCRDLGFCSLSDPCWRKLESSPLTIDEFTDEVLMGEGNGSGNEQLRKQVRSRVAKYYEVATNHGLWWLKFPENSV